MRFSETPDHRDIAKEHPAFYSGGELADAIARGVRGGIDGRATGAAVRDLGKREGAVINL